MSNVQIENGYTKIANELLESLARAPLNGSQRRIIDVILRYTYGFNRKDAELSLTFISKATDIRKDQVKKELKTLIDRKFLIIVQEASFNKTRKLAFNKDYSNWSIESRGATTPQDWNCNTELGMQYQEGGNYNTQTGGQLPHQEININKNIKKIEHDDFFEKLWSLYPKKKGKGQVSKTQIQKLSKIGYEELERAVNRYKQEVAGKDQQYIMYGSTFFNSGYVDYLDSNYAGQEELIEPNPEYQRLREMVKGV